MYSCHSILECCVMFSGVKMSIGSLAYQAFYGLKHYNLLETGSFLIRKLNQPTSCLMLQFKGNNTLKLPFDSSFK